MSIPEKENPGQVSKKKISLIQAKQRIASYCAYQERCLSEVRNKLEDYGITSPQAEKIIAQLADEDFINEQRFAESFVRGRFTVKKWGKLRIRQELKMRDIPNHYIATALDLIGDDEYLDTLNYLAKRKWSLTREPNLLKKKAKVNRFLMFRGFEADLIKEAVDAVSDGF
jgi:regulatory protein